MAQKLKHLHKIILSRKCNLIKTFSQQFLLPTEQQQFHSPPKKCPITCKKHYNLRRLLRASFNALKFKRNKFNHSQTKYLTEIIETHYFFYCKSLELSQMYSTRKVKLPLHPTLCSLSRYLSTAAELCGHCTHSSAKTVEWAGSDKLGLDMLLSFEMRFQMKMQKIEPNLICESLNAWRLFGYFFVRKLFKIYHFWLYLVTLTARL